MTKFLVYNEFVGFVFVEVKSKSEEKAREHINRIYGNHFFKLPSWVKTEKFITERA